MGGVWAKAGLWLEAFEMVGTSIESFTTGRGVPLFGQARPVADQGVLSRDSLLTRVGLEVSGPGYLFCTVFGFGLRCGCGT